MSEIAGTVVTELTNAGTNEDGALVYFAFEYAGGKDKVHVLLPFQLVPQLIVLLEHGNTLSAEAREKKYGKHAGEMFPAKATRIMDCRTGIGWNLDKKRYDVALSIQLGDNLHLNLSYPIPGAKKLADSLLDSIRLARTQEPPRQN